MSSFFSRIKNSESLPFSIDTASGKIMVRESLDRETRDSYVMTIYGEDHSTSPYLFGACSVTVNVGDVNDSPPRFSKSHYTAHIDEK